MGAVLLQYPQWFTPKRANRDELARARERLGDLPVCVEFRSPRWFGPDDRDRTFRWLSDHDLAYVVVDAPKSSELPTVVVDARATATSRAARVAFGTAADGIEVPGTVHRMDGVPVPLRAPLAGERPGVEDVLAAIEGRL